MGGPRLKHPNQKSYDYSANRQSARASKGNFDYSKGQQISKRDSNYHKLSTHSTSPSITDPDYVGKSMQLSAIPHDMQLIGKKYKKEAPESKFDGVLNEAKRNKKVIEMDFDKDLKLIKIIGEGSFGKVYKAKWDAEFVAVKIFTNIAKENVSNNILKGVSTFNSSGNKNASSNKHGLAEEVLQVKSVDDEQYKELYAEIMSTTSIPPHPNIIRINGFCRKPLCIVMEYMAGGSVQKLVYGLSNKPIPSVSEKLVILIKSCSGLKNLNEFKLHHRDVAARNILLGEYEKVIDAGTNVKITDFGMTRKDDENVEIQKTKNEHGPFKWMAPESIKEQKYNEKSDVYMFGITMWEIMYGRAPYEHLDDINTAMNVCVKNERPEFLWDLPFGLETLIKCCWDKDPNERPTFKEVAKRLNVIKKRVQYELDDFRKMDVMIEADIHKKEIESQIYAEKYMDTTSSVFSMDTNDANGDDQQQHELYPNETYDEIEDFN